MDENELTVDSRLTPFERIKLVICSLFELIEEEDKEKVMEFDKNSLQCYPNDLFLIQFGLLLKELYEKEFDNQSLIYLNTRTDDENYQSNNNFYGKDSFFDPNKKKKKNSNSNADKNAHYYATNSRKARNISAGLNPKKKQTSIINIITDYIEDNTHNESNKDTVKNKIKDIQLDNNEDNDNENNSDNDIEEENQRKRKKITLSRRLLSFIPSNNQTLKTQETDNYNLPIYSTRSLLTCNCKEKINYTRKQKAGINMLIGLEVFSKIPKNNLHNNALSQCFFQHRAFLYPTKPILDISLFSIRKYNNNEEKEERKINVYNYDRYQHQQQEEDEKEEQEQIQQTYGEEDQKVDDISNDLISTSLLNIIGTNSKHKPNQPSQNINKKDNNNAIIIKWLINLNLIKDSLQILSKAKSGVLYCDIINRCESRNKTINGIIRSPFTPKQEYLNINKALAYLRKINIRSESLWTADQIQQGHEEIIFALLNDLYFHYSKALGRVKSLGSLIKPNHLIKKNDETATLELNDSIFADNRLLCNLNQPMTQLSSLSNIMKTAKNNDNMSHHTSVTTSNICTIANCLGVNMSSIKPKEQRRLIRNKILKTQQSKDKSISIKTEKTIKGNNNTNSNLNKKPQCFIILKKSNIHQMKNQISKVSLTKQYKDNKLQ